jgi:hypothetical protein
LAMVWPSHISPYNLRRNEHQRSMSVEWMEWQMNDGKDWKKKWNKKMLTKRNGECRVEGTCVLVCCNNGKEKHPLWRGR